MNSSTDNATIQVVAQRITSLHDDVTEMREDMRERYREMSEAIRTLVRLEERQMNLNQSNEEIRRHFEYLDQRVDALEKEQPLTKQVVKWTLAAVSAIISAAAMFVAKMLGIF